MKAEVRKFMGAVGCLPKSYDESTKEYLKEHLGKLITLLKEEIQEMEDALANDDFVEVLDASVDQRYYTTQIQLTLELAGFNVYEAEQCVHANNSLKHTTSFNLAQQWIEELERETGVRDWQISSNVYDGETHHCLKKKETSKVSKWFNFPKVSLRPFVPEKYR